MGKDDVTLSAELDLELAQEIKERVDSNSAFISQVVDNLVIDYTKDLDSIMEFVLDLVKDEQNPPSDAELNNIVLELPAILYYASEGVEKLGIKEDVARAIRKEIYNSAHKEAYGTIADKQAEAEISSQQEYIVQVAYERSYRIIKAKIDAGYELLSSVKKVISGRITGMELSNIDPSRLRRNITK